MKTTNILPIVIKQEAEIITNDSQYTSSEYQVQEMQSHNDAHPQNQSQPAPLISQAVKFHLKYTNVKLTRQATKKNVVIAGPPRVQFCPFDDVVDELGKFVHLARVCGYKYRTGFRFHVDIN